MRSLIRTLGTIAGLAVPTPGLAADEPKSVKMVLRKVEVTFAVPDPTHKVQIAEIRKVGDEVWVRAEVRKTPGFGAQVISQAQDSLSIRLPDLPVKYIVTGKTWNWANKEKYTFVRELDKKQGEKLMESFQSGEEWYSRK